MSLTRERVESLAPDQASLAAALKLVKPTAWPVLAADGDASVLWGECQGSGATPYRVVVSPEDTSYKCTCPSRKFPCKHVLAMLWLRADKPERFESTSPPQWVEEWSARRRPGGGRPPSARKADHGAPTEAPSLEAALATKPKTGTPADPKPLHGPKHSVSGSGPNAKLRYWQASMNLTAGPSTSSRKASPVSPSAARPPSAHSRPALSTPKPAALPPASTSWS